MREIKFRAWDKEGKKMCYEELDQYSQLFVWFDGSVGQIDAGCTDGGLGSANVELMQFTGLLDKNGKEIYEGDIVQTYKKGGSKRFTYEVVWGEAEYIGYIGFAFLDITGSSIKSVPTNVIMDDAWEIEIIGNIYENPELLS